MTHWLILILFVLVVVMIRQPKKTTAEITSGAQGATGVGSALLQGFFTAPKK